MRAPAWLASWVLAAALAGGAGCSTPLAADDELPGVYTETSVVDDFHCGELLVPHGCVVVRIPRVDSGCAPEVGGYVVCKASIEWTAESGAALPASRLEVVAGGNETTGCQASPGSPCRVSGILEHTRHFDGPGQQDTWAVSITARLTTPGGAPPAEGHFTLVLGLVIRTEPALAAID
jgi:hypothetical protein